MERNEIITAVRQLVDEKKPFVLATVGDDGGPRLRWMGGLVVDEPLTVYMACMAGSRKMEHARRNPRAQLLFQSAAFDRVATLFGNCIVVDDPAVKRRLWEALPVLARYVSGPTDPGLGVLRFDTRRAELLVMQQGPAPQVVEL